MANDDKYGLGDFELYQVAREFRKKTYCLIRTLPPQEKYCLDPQMRRAAVSVTNNIAEGHGRWHYREFARYCRISRGSVEELLDDFHTCQDEHFGDQKIVADLIADAYTLIKRINGYISYLQKSQQGIDLP